MCCYKNKTITEQHFKPWKGYRKFWKTCTVSNLQWNKGMAISVVSGVPILEGKVQQAVTRDGNIWKGSYNHNMPRGIHVYLYRPDAFSNEYRYQVEAKYSDFVVAGYGSDGPEAVFRKVKNPSNLYKKALKKITRIMD